MSWPEAMVVVAPLALRQADVAREALDEAMSRIEAAVKDEYEEVLSALGIGGGS